MKLLVLTQAVDRNDPYVGFFHEWLVALAPKFDSIETICLKEGEHVLPHHVRVHSLGKEKRKESPVTYALRFLSYVRTLRRSYDAVFVHMNPEYVVLAGLLWKLLGKKIYLWYNHPKGGFRLAVAMFFADKVFYTSPLAASAGSKKSVRMPAGVDTDLFSPQAVERTANAIYLQGRVMPSKRVSVACEATDLLVARGIPATLTIVGPEEPAYTAELRRRHKDLIDKGTIVFLGPKPNRETPVLFSSHAVALNLASGGHYDKTVLEAMACETPVVISSRAFAGRVPEMWSGKSTPLEIADTLEAFFMLSPAERDILGKRERTAVVEGESLPALIGRLSEVLQSGYPATKS